MDLQNIFITAFQSLSRNKTRTLLTILGIVIGVGSVIMLMSIGDGLKNTSPGSLKPRIKILLSFFRSIW